MEMYKESRRTCTAIVLIMKPFVCRRSRCRRRRGLLKFPNCTTTWLSDLRKLIGTRTGDSSYFFLVVILETRNIT